MSLRVESSIVTIADIIQWDDRNELSLSPKYQRGIVWNENAKSYLIDTLIRGLPIPPIFIRQTTDIKTRKTFRDVIDGQQRLRSILGYINREEFAISKSHNDDFGGKRYSALPDETKELLLASKIFVVSVTTEVDAIIYDMFARLNSNNVRLNKQEVRNAVYWGEFKVFAYKLALESRWFFEKYGIMTDKDFTRMIDVELINSIAILFMNGIVDESNSLIEQTYKKYDNFFSDADYIREKTKFILTLIDKMFSDLDDLYIFKNKTYFYSLFAILVHFVYGINNLNIDRPAQFSKSGLEKNNNIDELNKCIMEFVVAFEKSKSDIADTSFVDFNTRRSTSKKEREKRIQLLYKHMVTYD